MPPLDLLECPPLLTQAEAAEILHLTLDEVRALLATGQLVGAHGHVRTATILGYISRRDREALAPPPKQTTVIVWPGPT